MSVPGGRSLELGDKTLRADVNQWLESDKLTIPCLKYAQMIHAYRAFESAFEDGLYIPVE